MAAVNAPIGIAICDASAHSRRGGVHFGIISGLSPISLLTDILSQFSAAAPIVSGVTQSQFERQCGGTVGRMKVGLAILPQNWLPWQRPLSDRKSKIRSVIIDQIPTIW